MTRHQLDLRHIDGPPDGAAVNLLDLTGEIDAANAREFDDALRRSIASGPVILDLSAVEFFDSAGFAVLDRRVADGGLHIVISPESVIRRAASVVDLPFHDSVDGALAALART